MQQLFLLALTELYRVEESQLLIEDFQYGKGYVETGQFLVYRFQDVHHVTGMWRGHIRGIFRVASLGGWNSFAAGGSQHLAWVTYDNALKTLMNIIRQALMVSITVLQCASVGDSS